MASQEQIIAAIRQSAVFTTAQKIALPIAGAVIALGGLLIWQLSETENNQTAGLVLMAVGAFLGIGIQIIVIVAGRKTAETAENIIQQIQLNPASLRWAYIHEQRNNNVTTVSVKMHFADATEYGIVKAHLPETPEEFLKSLYRLNPEIRLGYSDQLKEEYMNGGLTAPGEKRYTVQRIREMRHAAWRWAVPGLCLAAVAPIYYSQMSELEQEGNSIRVKWYIYVIYESMGTVGGTIFFAAIGGILLLIGIPKLIRAYSLKPDA